MNTKKIILIISTIIIFILVLIVFIIFLIIRNQFFVLSEKELKKEGRIESIKKNFSDKIIGTIIITQDEDSFLTDNGKMYILKPNYPYSMYEKMGIKTGQRVEIYGKFLNNDGLQPGMIKIIK